MTAPLVIPAQTVTLGTWSETDGRIIPVQSTTSGEIITTEAVTARVNHGFAYHCSAFDAALANNANLDMAITTPADDYVHMIIEAAASGLAEIAFYENTAFTGGNVETVYNLKRTSSRVWGGTMVSAPSVSDAGTLLTLQVMPGGTKNQAVGGDASFSLKWICKASETYMIRLTNRSGAAIRASIGCNHYTSSLLPDA